MSIRGLACRVICCLALAGCTHEMAAPPAEGSWVEILEMELAPDALAVEELPVFRAVEVHPDRLVFTFDGPSPLRAGHVVGGDAGGTLYLRRILEVSALSGGRVEARTEPAAINEFYADLHFIVHYRPRRGASSVAPAGDVGGAAMSSTEECTADTAPCVVTGGESVDADTAGCSTELDGDLTFEPYVETDFDADFEFDHGIGVDWGLPPDADFEPTAITHIEGTIRSGIRFHASSEATLSCQADFAAALGGGTAPKVLLAKGTLGVVPIPWSIYATPIFEGRLDATASVGELSADAWAAATGSVDFGIRDGDELVHDPGFELSGDASVETERAGSLSAHGEVEAGVKITLQIGETASFDEAGVSGELGMQADATMDLTGTLGVNLTTGSLGCDWSLDLPWSAQAEFGVSFDASASGEALGVGFDEGWDKAHTWEPYVLASGSLGTRTGSFEWCAMAAEMCDAEGSGCHDDYYDNGVCMGMMGQQACDGGQFRRCTCGSEGWTECGPCTDVE